MMPQSLTMGASGTGWVHYLPLLTTAVATAFFIVLLRAIRERKSGPHLLWWAAGVFFYGLGTLIESSITLGGNTVFLNKAWYVAGALLGGYPLAQGSVWLLTSRKFALNSTYVSVAFVAMASILVLLSPVNMDLLEPHRPTGKVLEWSWVRMLTPFVNLYAAAFLIGGAVWSAFKYRKQGEHRARVQGNWLIAIGAILPGIGGSMAKAGYVEALYVGELIGLIIMWLGYETIARKYSRTRAAAPVPQASAS
jgi:hypothetical protein